MTYTTVVIYFVYILQLTKPKRVQLLHLELMPKNLKLNYTTLLSINIQINKIEKKNFQYKFI